MGKLLPVIDLDLQHVPEGIYFVDLPFGYLPEQMSILGVGH